MLLGEFSYEDMEERGNRVLAPVYFGLYMILVFFVLTNMFVAIVTDAYAIVHEQSQESKPLGTALRKTVRRNWNNLKRRYNRYLSFKNLGNTLSGNFVSSSDW